MPHPALADRPGELIPEQYVVDEIRFMRRQGAWAVEDIAFYNRVSLRAARVLSDDCAQPGEGKIERVLFPWA